MRLTKTGKLFVIFAAFLLGCGYIAYRNSSQMYVPPELAPSREQRTEKSVSPEISKQNPSGKNDQRAKLNGSKIDAILLHKDASAINPSDIDSLFDGEELPPNESPPPE